MKKFEGNARVGLRENETNRLIAVYPEEVRGTDEQLEDKVKFWFYQQSCSAEDVLRDCFVDVLTENELKNLQ